MNDDVDIEMWKKVRDFCQRVASQTGKLYDDAGNERIVFRFQGEETVIVTIEVIEKAIKHKFDDEFEKFVRNDIEFCKMKIRAGV